MKRIVCQFDGNDLKEAWIEEGEPILEDKLCRKKDEEVKEEIADRDVRFGVYQHFKGNLYLVLDTGYDSSDEEEVVIYRALYPDDEGNYRIWVRKKKEFLEKVIVDGVEKSRFFRLDFHDFTKTI